MGTRIYFATDVHGSEVCWMKFVNSAKFYKADVIILGGDLTGKAIVPIVKGADGKYKIPWIDKNLVLDTSQKVDQFERGVAQSGYYPYRLNEKEMKELEDSPEKVDALFTRLMLERLKKWCEIADERFKGTDTQCWVCPGNDDRFEIDSVIRESESIMNAEGKVVMIDNHYEMISTGWTNPTPWNTHRETSEEELYKKIVLMGSQVKNMSNCIFNLHAPPYDSGLDKAPALDENLRPRYAGQLMVSVGSTAVADAIRKYQPLLGLHGHVHESRGECKIGRTLCINPGSLYEEGILAGVLVELDEKGIKSCFPLKG